MVQKIEILFKDKLLMELKYSGSGSLMKVNNISGQKNAYLPYISKDCKQYDVSVYELIKFLETRCVPKTREGIDELLKKKYNLTEYNAIEICKQMHGVSHSDFIWLRFNDEKLRYDDVKIR